MSWSLVGVKGLKGEVTHEPFHSHDLLSNSLYCVPYTAYNFSLENLYRLK